MIPGEVGFGVRRPRDNEGPALVGWSIRDRHARGRGGGHVVGRDARGLVGVGALVRAVKRVDNVEVGHAVRQPAVGVRHDGERSRGDPRVRSAGRQAPVHVVPGRVGRGRRRPREIERSALIGGVVGHRERGRCQRGDVVDRGRRHFQRIRALVAAGVHRPDHVVHRHVVGQPRVGEGRAGDQRGVQPRERATARWRAIDAVPREIGVSHRRPRHVDCAALVGRPVDGRDARRGRGRDAVHRRDRRRVGRGPFVRPVERAHLIEIDRAVRQPAVGVRRGRHHGDVDPGVGTGDVQRSVDVVPHHVRLGVRVPREDGGASDEIRPRNRQKTGGRRRRQVIHRGRRRRR